MGEEGLGFRAQDRVVYREQWQEKICQLLGDWIALYTAKTGEEREIS
jgi:hypothetical protein